MKLVMHKHFGAYQAKLIALAAIGSCGVALLERREEPTIKSVSDAIEKINSAFHEFKSTNDKRLEELKKGNSTSDLDAKLASMEKEISTLTDLKAQLEKLETRMSRPGAFGGGDRENRETEEAREYREAFVEWVRQPTDASRQQRMSSAAKALESKSAQVVTSTGSAGGFALPEVIESRIARLTIDISPIRQIATVRTVGSPDYKELFDVGGAGFEWLGEGGTRNQTNTPDLAEVAPTFGTISAKPQASEESLDDLFFNVEDWLAESVAEGFAAGEGAAHVGGNGTNKPTGFLAGPTPVATSDASRAFGTLQYIASGQAAALPTALDTLLDVVYALRARYRANARWVGGKLIFAALRKYKDTTGQYLWQPSTVAGQPDMFLGYPVTEAEDMPVVAAGAFPLAFGDFKEGYVIADRIGVRMTRDEITTPGFVKFYTRKRTGGKIRNSQAIKLLKIAAS